MKKIYILLIICLAFSLASCGCGKIKMSDNPEVIRYGEINKYAIEYDGQIFYHVPTTIAIDIANDAKKGKFSVWDVQVNKSGVIQAIDLSRTYVIKRNDPILLTLYDSKDIYRDEFGNPIMDANGKPLEYVSMYQVIMLYEGTDLCFDVKQSKQ